MNRDVITHTECAQTPLRKTGHVIQRAPLGRRSHILLEALFTSADRCHHQLRGDTQDIIRKTNRQNPPSEKAMDYHSLLLLLMKLIENRTQLSRVKCKMKHLFINFFSRTLIKTACSSPAKIDPVSVLPSPVLHPGAPRACSPKRGAGGSGAVMAG